MRKIITLEGLRKVKGVSFEEIIEIIDREQIEHRVAKKPDEVDRFLKAPYFRTSRIDLYTPGYRVVSCEILSRNLHWEVDIGVRQKSLFFKASYEMLPDFDFSSLDGAITFHYGKLVERVELIDRGIKTAHSQL